MQTPNSVRLFCLTPNASGWHHTNVVVHFSATDTESGVQFVTSDVTLTTETNDAEVVGIAFDNAGNSSTNVVFVSIDLTPPELNLDPGQGDTFDNSHPLLIVDYAGAACSGGTSVPACGPSGLNPDSLSITLDSVSAADPSSNSRQGLFYRYANRAVENRVQSWPQ